MRTARPCLLIALISYPLTGCPGGANDDCPNGFHTDDRFSDCQGSCAGVYCGGGHCRSTNATQYVCECDPGYDIYGGVCVKICEEGSFHTGEGCRNPCGGSGCGHYGTCIPVSADAYNCECQEGFESDGVKCQPVCETSMCGPSDTCVADQCVGACPYGCPDSYQCHEASRRCRNPCEIEDDCEGESVCVWGETGKQCLEVSDIEWDLQALAFKPDWQYELRGHESGYWFRDYPDDIPRPDRGLRWLIENGLVIRMEFRGPLGADFFFRWNGGESYIGPGILDFTTNPSNSHFVLYIDSGRDVPEAWGLKLRGMYMEVLTLSSGVESDLEYRVRMSGLVCTDNALGLEGLLNYWEKDGIICLEADFYDLPAYPVE